MWLPPIRYRTTRDSSTAAGIHALALHERTAKANGVNFRVAVEVSDVDLDQKRVVVDGIETITAKHLIIATGSRPRPLGVPGEKEYRGNGISYCATCDAKYFEDRDVVVIGGGNSAIEESLFISRFAKTVTIVHQFDTLQANKDAQKKAFDDPKISILFEHEPERSRSTVRWIWESW